jgi:3-oxoacyl-[acyl-carrier protein] reductase
VAAAFGDAVAPISGDVAVLDSFIAARDLALSHFGGLHILVNNAGVGQLPMPMEEMDEALFDRLFNVNIRSIYNGARAVVPHFKAQKYGAILNVASTGGVSPRPNLTWYNASKGWDIAATRGMAVELAPFGIRVNAINPVAGDTPLLSTFIGSDSEESRARIVATIPIGRLSTPADMGNAAAFLCSDEASMITGVDLNVDGGKCI